MTMYRKSRLWAPALYLAVATLVLLPQAAPAQSSQSSQSITQPLLEKAHALEVRGRMDMASSVWNQVLLNDPNNPEAIAGLGRAAKSAGNTAEANVYIEKLRAMNPNDPNIARIEGMGTQQNQSAQLQQAGKYAQAGQYAQAMNIYRQTFGGTPPPGDMALAYYETESATEDGRPHAIAGLRALVDKYPADSRYQIALGKILTYNPRTRAEGRRYLERHPKDPEAVEALRQSLLWDAQNPASGSDIRAYLAQHPDPQLAQALRSQPAPPRAGRTAGRAGASASSGPVVTAEEQAAVDAQRARTAEEQAAYRALNAHHIEEAEDRFKAILASNPESGPALAGMGYIRMQQSNFGGAISFLSEAKQNGVRDAGLETALNTSRFWYTMGEGQAALNENDLPTAQQKYQTALAMRPTSPEALQGLGGTLLKAQEPEAAINLYERYVRAKPADPTGWRGLFMAQYGAGQASSALVTERRMSPSVRAQLMRDPDFLRTLASAYSAVGRDADAQRVLHSALDLPFPPGAQGLKAETQLQYAGLLQQANHLDQAAGLYRNVLGQDPSNANAWQGLVRVEHTMGQDPQALQTLESMPPSVYDTAMRDPGFESTVASIYQGQGKLDVAQDLLERSVSQQASAGQKVSLPLQIQLAGIYLQHNNPQLAYPIYQRVLNENPDRLDAWKGLLSALHSNGRDQEALAQIQQIPLSARSKLETDPEYLQTVAAVYNSLGQPREASLFLARVQQYYQFRHSLPPADIDIQNAWLQYNGGNDAALYRALMMLGSRTDLAEEQRHTVQTIWANWAVRRANQLAAANDPKRSLAILNAAARAFPDNPGVLNALAGGYSRAGMPKQAITIFKAQDMSHATASDYKTAVGAALVANDQKDAETWLRYGLDAYPKDPQLLCLGAKFEQARGSNGRAADYYRACLNAMPAPDPGAELANELSRPVPSGDIRLPGASGQSQDLASLLAPGGADPTSVTPAVPQAAPLPYLPSYANSYGNAPVQMQDPGGSGIPVYTGTPPILQPSAPQAPTRLRDYVPQASNTRPSSLDGFVIPRPDTQTAQVIPQTAPPPSQYVPQPQTLPEDQTPTYALSQSDADLIAAARAASQRQPVQRTTRQAQSQPLPLTSEPYAAQPAPQTQTSTIEYGPYKPYVPPTANAAVQVDLGRQQTYVPLPQPEMTDVVPTVRNVPNSRVQNPSYIRPDIAAAEAARIRRQQSNPVMMGQSKPPQDEVSVPTQNAQYTQPYNAAQAQGDQVTQPQTRPNPGVPADANPTQTGDADQQYPQPGTAPAGTASRRRSTRRATPAPQTTQAPPPQSSMTYPAVAQPLGSQPYPTIGAPYVLPPAPTDAQLEAKNVPPLRGGYSQVPISPTQTLTEREQTERDLATLEASYSGWIGGTGIARYRSGTPGIDRMTDLEAPVEASVVAGKTWRFTVVPKAVFLNSGAIALNTSGAIGVPFGTLSAAAVNAPAQQFSSGVGGEIQAVTNNFGVALGYTPYEFLVDNITVRVRWRPFGGHFTFLGERDSVKETQLSYAGLRDPGSAGLSTAGNIWGGVVSTGGTLRFDLGNEHSGIYFSATGAQLTGYHVLPNTTFNGAGGAYFRVKVWPEYGSLNIGGSLYGAHFAHNELGLTYGQGGYFSPDAYFLAAIPITFNGHYKTDLHYVISGAVGLQTFQEDAAPYFPLDPSQQTGALDGCTLLAITSKTCGYFAQTAVTGANYSLTAQLADRIADHWYIGGYATGNNTNNYNTISGAFYVRYLFRPQYPTEDYPTGLFPLDGFRPLRVP
jgi:tetratricopeptide (TPR) repeat protein